MTKAKKLQIDTSELSEDDIFTDPFFTTTRPQYDHNKSISEPLTADILESLRSDGEMDGAFINNDVGSSNNDGVQEVKPRMSPISRGSSLPVDVLRKTHARKSAAKLCRNQNGKSYLLFQILVGSLLPSNLKSIVIIWYSAHTLVAFIEICVTAFDSYNFSYNIHVVAYSFVEGAPRWCCAFCFKREELSFDT